MTPRPAVALNFAQLVARLSQSRLSRRKLSTVVPQCISALAKMMAECDTLLRTSVAALTLFRICARSGHCSKASHTLHLLLHTKKNTDQRAEQTAQWDAQGGCAALHLTATHETLSHVTSGRRLDL